MIGINDIMSNDEVRMKKANVIIRGVVGYVIDCASRWLPVQTPQYQSNTGGTLVVWPGETRTVML